ncbi:MAG: 6-hydroxymethylpterin diphosphokinase MptE-like protein [Treponemataceae bacterium]
MNNTDKPCLVQARQGFSVFYGGKYLYSQYDAQKAIKTLVSALEILPETLILCFSPVLCYGLDDLLAKISNDSFILAIESNKDLYDFSAEYRQKYQNNPKIAFVYIDENTNSLKKILDVCTIVDYRRCLPVEFSAGSSFCTDFYKKISRALTNEISQFWKNRITLIKMGRLYARNIFKNLSLLPLSKKIIKNSIDCPILVAGAGLSLEKIIEIIKEKPKAFFIIAVDSAIIPLLKNNITPDLIITIECQLANEQAFIGMIATHNKIPLISDLTARPHINNQFCANVSLFLSEYAKLNFLKRLFSSAFSPEKNQPLGSVGLTAIDIALQLRKNDLVPIFFTGLDFCYIVGKTHCKDAPHHRFLLNTTNRFHSLDNVTASFSYGVAPTQGKNGAVISTPILKNYAQMLCNLFAQKTNLFDISFDGLSVGPQCMTEREFCNVSSQLKNAKKQSFFETHSNNGAYAAVKKFYDQEEKALQRLKEIFTTGAGTSEEIEEILLDREYLYLHFPDGHKLRLDSDFLKRIRGEIDCFIKDIHFGQKNLEKIHPLIDCNT